MSTIVRVKRRLDESPLEALVVHCKKARIDESEQITPSLFVFSGTLHEKDHTLRHIKKEWLRHYEETVAGTSVKSASDMKDRLRASHDTAIKNQRLKILDLRRGIPIDAQKTEENCTVLDLHRYKEGHDEMSTEDDGKYAYDLYISKEKDFDHNMLDEIEKVEFAAHNLDVGYRNDCVAMSDDEDPDEDDENNENNWRNDYPEEEDGNDDDSIGENEMRDAMNRFTIDDDLSSDDGEEELVYENAHSRDYSKYANLSEDDVNRYGLAYAKYKLKLLRVDKNPDEDDVPKLIEYSSDRSHGSMNESNSDGDISDASYYDDAESDRDQER